MDYTIWGGPAFFLAKKKTPPSRAPPRAARASGIRNAAGLHAEDTAPRAAGNFFTKICPPPFYSLDKRRAKEYNTFVN